MKSATRCLRAAALVALGGLLSSATAATARADQESDRLRPDDPALVPATGSTTGLPSASTTAGGPAAGASTAVNDANSAGPLSLNLGERAARSLADGHRPEPLSLDASDLLLQGRVYKKVANPSAGQGPTEQPVYYAADALAAEKEAPNIHGFLNASFKTAYVTPRGLVVENAGVVFQPVGGLVFPIGDIGDSASPVIKGFTFVTGVWNSINSAQDDTNVGPWNEMDYFASFSGGIGSTPLSFTLTYGLWSFPSRRPLISRRPSTTST